MNEQPTRTAPREIGDIIRQTADLRRLCLSLREAKNREGEAALLAEFERAVSEPKGPSAMDPQVLRAGFKELWRRGQYDQIVAVGRRLPEDLLGADETVLMYYLCASNRRSGSSSDPGRQE